MRNETSLLVAILLTAGLIFGGFVWWIESKKRQDVIAGPDDNFIYSGHKYHMIEVLREPGDRQWVAVPVE